MAVPAAGSGHSAGTEAVARRAISVLARGVVSGIRDSDPARAGDSATQEATATVAPVVAHPVPDIAAIGTATEVAASAAVVMVVEAAAAAADGSVLGPRWVAVDTKPGCVY